MVIPAMESRSLNIKDMSLFTPSLLFDLIYQINHITTNMSNLILAIRTPHTVGGAVKIEDVARLERME